MPANGLTVGVVGATGAVGSTILEVLSEREFPAAEVVALTSKRSAGKKVAFGRRKLTCLELSAETIDGLDLVLSSAGGTVSAEWAPKMVEAGAVVVDNTSYWRMHDDVPLVVPEVNPDAIDSHEGIVANPNCSTMQMVVALQPIERAVGIERIVVSTYQSVSGTGNAAVEELRTQTEAVLAGRKAKPGVYPHQIAFNAIPQVEVFAEGDDYTTEERKMIGETRKIMGLSEKVGISPTCVRVPVFTGHSESINLRTRKGLSADECRELLARAPGVAVVDAPGEGIYPLATAAAGRDEVLVGRIREDPSQDRTLNMWVVGDNLRKGAATNAVQLAELLLERDLLGELGAVDLSFGEALLLVGLLLAIAAILSGALRGTVLSISVLSVGAGIGLAATGVITVSAHSVTVIDLVTLALILTLFSDGLTVERELLTVHWGPVTRAIVVAMPITLVLLGLASKALFGGELSWPEAFLLAAVLTPTDPVVSSSVVTSKRVPMNLRHVLNLESGLNDGLALPLVLFFLIFASPTGNAEHEAVKLLGEAGFGAVVGVVLGVIGGRLQRHLPGPGIIRRYQGIYALGIGLTAFGVADVTFGNGLIAAFVCGITLGAAAHEIPDSFVEFSENVSAISQVLTFFVFGALIVATGYNGEIWRLVIFILFALLVARPAAIFIAFIRERLPGAHKLFISWFGPKGVSSMLFGLYVLNSAVDSRSLIFDVAAFTILASITAHGFTETVGAKWIEGRMPDS